MRYDELQMTTPKKLRAAIGILRSSTVFATVLLAIRGDDHLEQSPIRLYRIRRPRNSLCIRWV